MKENSAKKIKEFKNMQQYLIKVDTIRNSDAIKLYKLLFGTKQSFIIYKDNYIRLKKRLKSYYRDQLEIMDDEIRRWRTQRKIIGDFHSVISSAQYFIEYLKKNKRQTNFQNELEHEIEIRFINNELYDFIFVLRNYISHVNRLPLISRIEFVKDKEVNSISYESFDKMKLSQYIESENKVHKLADSFLNGSDKYINLNNVLIDFDINLSEMYAWFVQKFTKANKLEIEGLIFKTEECYALAKIFGFETSVPLNKVQVRHLKILLTKIE